MKELTKEEAIQMYESGKWKELTVEERAAVQLAQKFLFMPFSEFHLAMEQILGRSVWTHEFAYKRLLIDEMAGKKGRATMDEILKLIPAEKLIVLKIETPRAQLPEKRE